MAELDSAPDETLLRLIGDGRTEALSVLFRRRQQSVFRFALHLTGSRSLADDVTQDVFVAVMSGSHRFDPDRASVVAWLCGFARNYVRRRLAAHHLEVLVDDEEEGEPVAVGADPLEDLTKAERVEALRRAVLSLPLTYREPVVLCDLQEMTYADAAAALGCPVGTVRSRLHRGRALLTAKMLADQRPSGVAPAIRKCLA